MAFYGDDLTGTVSTAEALVAAGLRAPVFLEPPALSRLQRDYPDAAAVGVAGVARTLPPAAMTDTLPAIFGALRSYGAPLFLYKVCSTFDSSPAMGSIGRAIELAKAAFPSTVVPVLPAAPRMGRFTVFGHHFATSGSTAGEAFRLDRHPTMARHPVTPMTESDLREHLALQTTLPIGLIDVRALDQGKDRVRHRLADLAAGFTPLAVFDCLTEAHMTLICDVLWERAVADPPLLVVGSQDVAWGLAQAWAGAEPAGAAEPDGHVSAPGPTLVVSGSCADVSGLQIREALAAGFVDVGCDPPALLPRRGSRDEDAVVERALAALNAGLSVVIHTAVGPDDGRISATRERARQLGVGDIEADAHLGRTLGRVARRLVEGSRLKRMVVVGGDTSGRVVRELGVESLEVVGLVGSGAPLCRIRSHLPAADGLEVAFKGGQAGAVDYLPNVAGQRRPIATQDGPNGALPENNISTTPSRAVGR